MKSITKIYNMLYSKLLYKIYLCLSHVIEKLELMKYQILYVSNYNLLTL